LGKGAVVEGGVGTVRSGEGAYGEGLRQKEKMKETGREYKGEAVEQAQRYVVLLPALFDN
jgi:hypothetical protein